jgi:ATP-dependent DNA ligase
VQPKLNGIRALYQNGYFQSRDEIPFNQVLLKHIADVLQQHVPANLVLDGELYVHGWALQRINAAVTPVRLSPTPDTLQVQYHIFDCVDFKLPFAERHNLLLQMLLGSPVELVITRKVHTPAEADAWYVQFVNIGYEGMMYRINGCPYTTPKALWHEYAPHAYTGKPPRSGFLADKNNRSNHLLKRKDWQDDEFICVNVVEGEGKRSGMVGAFECITKDKKTFSVGSFAGFTNSNLMYYLEYPPIKRKLKIKYLCLSDAGIPLNPTLLAVL